MNGELRRCFWVNPNNPLYLAYHDEEWGEPCHDERMLFEMLILEGFQAGLSWEGVLKTDDIHPPKTGISVHFSCSLP